MIRKKRCMRCRYSFPLIIVAAFLLVNIPSTSRAQSVEVFTNLGLYGGQIYTIAIDPVTPDKMFAGSYMGEGLFMTVDGGSSWQAVAANGTIPGEDEFKNQAVFAVKIAPSDNQVIWVAHNYWVEKSSDGGKTWTHIKNRTMQGSEFRICRSLVSDPTNSNVVYVGAGGPNNTYSNGAVYKTTDGGATWTKMNGGNDVDFEVVDMDIDPQDHNTIYAVTNSSGFGTWGGTFYESKDAGATWSAVFSLTPYGGTFLSVAVKPNDSNTVFTGSGYGIMVHHFNGTTWDFPTFPVPSSMVVEDIAFDPQNPNTVYATWLAPVVWGGDGIGKVGRSTDGGTTWQIYPHSYNFLALAARPANQEIVIAGDINRGLYKSQDHGQTWTPINNGINAVIVNSLAIDPNDSTHILAGTVAGLYEKKGVGSWLQLTDNETNAVSFDPTNSQTIYAGITGALAKTTDGSQSWTYSNQLGNGNNDVMSIAIDSMNTTTLFVAVRGRDSLGGVYKSTDGGGTFQQVLDGINQANQHYPFNTVAIDPSNNLHVLAGGGSFFAPLILGDLWESVDGGATWQRTQLQNIIVNALLINPDIPKLMYAGTGYSGGLASQNDASLYKSIDGGATWSASSDGIPGYPTPWNAVTDLAFSRQNKDIVYASTLAQGIYASNQAEKWLNLGTPRYDVFAIASSSLYVATQAGMLQLTGTGVIAGKVTDSLSQTAINNATVFTDLGALSTSVDGDFIMVSSAGTCYVTAVADGHANVTTQDVAVTGGNVTWLDISMQSGVPDPSVGPAQNVTLNTGGGTYCFIATAAYGSPLAGQVEILRRFRDAYLLPYPAGQKMVHLYYRTAKPIALYIEDHPWLKPVVRLVLYPLVGFAWFLLSTTAWIKGFIGSILLTVLYLFVKRRRTAIKIGLLIMSTLLFTGHPAQAATLFQQVGISSSPNPVGSGARAVGMGGAFIAIADDATAASWNPAGLIQLEKPELSIVGELFYWKESYSSQEHPEIDSQVITRDSNLNYLSVTYPFKYNRNMVISVNYQRLYEFKKNLNYQYNLSSTGLDLVQDKHFEQDGYLGAYGLAYAVQITTQFSAGVTFNLWTDQLFSRNGWSETYTERGVGTQGGAPVTIDTTITDRYSQFRGINANFGVLWNVNEHLTAGAVVKTPFRASLHHEFIFTTTSVLGPPANTTTSSQQSITEEVKLRMPLSYGLGLSMRVSDALSFAFDIYRTEWSQYVLTDAQGNEFSPIDGRPKDQSSVSDTTQIRLGGEYLFIGNKTVVPVRGGLFYDPEPSHGSVKDFYGISIGSGISYQRIVFDAAYQLRWGHNIDTGNLINSSRADITQHLLLASIIYHF